MKRIQKRLAEHRVATYCIVTFALTWAFWFAAVYPRALPLMEAGKSVFSDSLTVMLVGAGMFFPAIGVVVTRLLTGEGFRNVWIKPVRFRRTWKYYLAGWLGPIALVAVGGVAYFLLNPGQFDPSMSTFVETMQRQLEATGQSASMDEEQIRMLGYAQLALVLVAPLLNCVTCFGEEWGWRGYLLPHMLEKRSATFSAVTIGIIWGLWHAPITALGHNYGLDACGKLPAGRARPRCREQLRCGPYHVSGWDGQSLRWPHRHGNRRRHRLHRGRRAVPDLIERQTRTRRNGAVSCSLRDREVTV